MKATFVPSLAAAVVAAFVPPQYQLPAHTRAQHLPFNQYPAMVHIYGGGTSLPAARRRSSAAAEVSVKGGAGRMSPTRTHAAGERPPDPMSLASPERLKESVSRMLDWFQGKSSVLVLTGAGLSTESGIPDYRGFGGSYHRGHKPMVHDQFMKSEAQRRRYWGRSIVGWRDFYASEPNSGHYALADLERLGRIGVAFDDRPSYYGPDRSEDWMTSDGLNRISIITQNVDGLHRRAGSQLVTELHGRGDVVRCMHCGLTGCRREYHDVLDELNGQWLGDVLSEAGEKDMKRADGDAAIPREAFDDVVVPSCNNCGKGFVKPDVVFFGDSVPRHRVERCYGAVGAADGLLCVGSSLAVHSAFRFVRAAADSGVPIAILNVGETRAETSGIGGLTKVESPAGPTLSGVVREMGDEETAQW